MHADFALQFELGDAAQVLVQDFFLDLELVLVCGVLVVASAAAAKMRTRQRNAVRRRLDDCRGLGAGETGLLFGENNFDFFSRKNEGNENGLAPSAGVGGKASESVAAVNELFNVQEQELILRHASIGDRHSFNERGETTSASGLLFEVHPGG